MKKVRALRLRLGTALCAVSLAAGLGFAGAAQAQKVDGVKDLETTAPVNLQVTPTDAFVRIRGWSLPAPSLPLAILGSWGGKGTINGAGDVNVPIGQISTPSQFQFPRDINGEEETMTVSLFGRGDWTGNINPLNGEASLNMPMTLKIEASHVRMVDIPWPGGWIYGNIECTVPLDFGPLVSGAMDPPDPAADPAPVLEGSAYDPATGQFTVINNSMTIGGFDCTRPDIGSGQVEDELNAAVAIPSPAGRADAKFNMTFLEGGNILRPEPAIRPAFSAISGQPLTVALSGSKSFAKAGVKQYHWDLNGDGESDVESKGPDLTQEFPAPGTQEVGLKVVDRDGDASGWLRKDVTISDRAGAGVPRLAGLKIRPKLRKAKPGSKVKFMVSVKNVGLALAEGTKLCAKVPKRQIGLKKRCPLLGDIGPGETRSRKFVLKVRGNAKRGRKMAVRFRASAGPGYESAGRARIRVAGGSSRR